jgi:hypothetical protein
MNRIIELRPIGGGWKVFEGPGVEPVFVHGDAKESALAYATTRAKCGRCEIRVLDASGKVLETLVFSESERTG